MLVQNEFVQKGLDQMKACAKEFKRIGMLLGKYMNQRPDHKKVAGIENIKSNRKAEAGVEIRNGTGRLGDKEDRMDIDTNTQAAPESSAEEIKRVNRLAKHAKWHRDRYRNDPVWRAERLAASSAWSKRKAAERKLVSTM